MPAVQGGLRLDQISQKWRDLAERRLAYFTELYGSGRWQRYYTPEDFAVRMRDVVKAAQVWSHLADRASSEEILAEQQQQKLPQRDDKIRSAA
jgi:uncharacterized repeat protein (TIGR03809 family)